ncbi:hypothetical protein EYZ11_003048 [Aspergillus tanneri]|uniref:Glutamyl-tRNA(Gln) amidotransferase subunit A, mitochondrial n=1 Tax=Aspergillus tanneri TaxID=1220188 RepID=A0A4S3JPW1_9EURO|nr:hypothetical protein EYZ11_003048 [Aspergillus tanneri]
MSLLREAERCIAKQKSQVALNAFITTLRPSGQWLERVRDAEIRREKGENAIMCPDLSVLTSADRCSPYPGKPRSKVDGRLIAIKDNICTRNLPTTCASGILQQFSSPSNATVVEQLESAGAVVAGKTNLDEFVQEEVLRLSLRINAMRGSVRLPAAYTGTVGFKPSYGLISRWGVVAYANSLDTVGILGKSTTSVRDIFSILNKYDPRDPTSLSPSSRSRIASHLEAPSLSSRMNTVPLKIGVPLEYNISELAPSIRLAWSRSLSYMQQQGHSIRPVSLPATKLALSAYYVLAPAEASSNLAKYDGVRYGTRFEEPDYHLEQDGYLYANTRGGGLGPEVKRRILLGTFSLSADAIDNYFIQAQRIRRLVQHDFNAIFNAAQPLTFCLPGVGIEPKNNVSPLDAYMNDVFTVPASLAGLPSVSVPVTIASDCQASEDADSAGIQIIGQYGDDELVLKVGKCLEGRGF